MSEGWQNIGYWRRFCLSLRRLFASFVWSTAKESKIAWLDLPELRPIFMGTRDMRR
ncbi:MAG TPA: hypothetical protein VNF99_20025 [Stellaceae bacterium]|nr:hypothetical protein [Stellaceae bacterium]